MCVCVCVLVFVCVCESVCLCVCLECTHKHTSIRAGAQSGRHDRRDPELLFLVQLSRGVYSEKSAAWVDLLQNVTRVGTVPRQSLDPEQAPDPRALVQTSSWPSGAGSTALPRVGTVPRQGLEPRQLV